MCHPTRQKRNVNDGLRRELFMGARNLSGLMVKTSKSVTIYSTNYRQQTDHFTSLSYVESSRLSDFVKYRAGKRSAKEGEKT